jgi:hypothetical protein
MLHLKIALVDVVFAPREADLIVGHGCYYTTHSQHFTYLTDVATVRVHALVWSEHSPNLVTVTILHDYSIA